MVTITHKRTARLLISIKSFFVIPLLFTLLLSSCANMKDMFSFGKEKAETYLPAEQLVMKGMDEYNVGKYYLAVDYFNEILDRYPYSPQAPLAELKAADCNY